MPAAGFTVEGIAWDRGHGIKRSRYRSDGGTTWKPATLGQDLGRFAFRALEHGETGTRSRATHRRCVRATNNAGATQVEKLMFNPAGYHDNVPQSLIAVTVA